MIRITVRRLCGQRDGAPSGVADQSCARMRAPISPPPARKSNDSPESRSEPRGDVLNIPTPCRGRFGRLVRLGVRPEQLLDNGLQLLEHPGLLDQRTIAQRRV